jgi:hypothetical protein
MERAERIAFVELSDGHNELFRSVVQSLLSARAAQLTDNRVGQPMTLNASQPFTIADGRAGLVLLLDNAVRLPVLFPREAIPVLRRSLDTLEGLSSGTASAPPKN